MHRVEPASPPETSEGATYYRYDDHGRVVIVDSLARVPAAARHSARPIALPPPPAPAGALQQILEAPAGLHWPSFAAGVGCSVIALLLALSFQRGMRRLMRYALFAGAVAVGAAAYFGWVRRSSGEDAALFASPKAMIEDARSAVEKMNQRTREQQKVLEELQKER
jgi:hypothetical protein